MNKVTILKGIAAPLIRNNVDTDAIIPSREMKSVSKSGLSGGLFAPWRYLDEKTRVLNPDFVLNKAAYKDASILLSGDNFGCGSSREHAVWALKEYGIRCIIAESFGSIFYRNCVANGILPIELSKEIIEQLADQKDLTIDLPKQLISYQNKNIPFIIGEAAKQPLINGLDPIAETLQLLGLIENFRQLDSEKRSWIYKEQ